MLTFQTQNLHLKSCWTYQFDNFFSVDTNLKHLNMPIFKPKTLSNTCNNSNNNWKILTGFFLHAPFLSKFSMFTLKLIHINPAWWAFCCWGQWLHFQRLGSIALISLAAALFVYWVHMAFPWYHTMCLSLIGSQGSWSFQMFYFLA